MTIRVLVADDHDIICAGIRSLLTHIDGAAFVGEAHNGRDAVEQARKLVPNIVLMDIVMPELNGIDAGRQILSQGAGIRLMAISGRTDRQIVLEAIHAGFSGYLTKSYLCDELEPALRAVNNGKTFFSPTINEVVIADYVRSASNKRPITPSPLSVREREVLQLVAEGLTSKEISNILHVSSKTIETHRLQIMDKLDIRTVAGLTKYALRHGITSPD